MSHVPDLFKHIKDFVQKKEVLLQNKEPLFYDVTDFFTQKYPELKDVIFPISFSHGVLRVSAASSVALQEFFLIKNVLLNHLREKKHPVQDVITRLH